SNGRESRRVFIRRDYNGDGVNASSVQRGGAQGLLRHVEFDRQRQVVRGGGRQRAHLLQLQRAADQDVVDGTVRPPAGEGRHARRRRLQVGTLVEQRHFRAIGHAV